MNKESVIETTASAMFIFFIAYVAYSLMFPPPKFKVDDCVGYVQQANEFEDEKIISGIHRIFKVGAKTYLVDEGGDYNVYYFRYLEKHHVLIDCKTGEQL